MKPKIDSPKIEKKLVEEGTSDNLDYLVKTQEMKKIIEEKDKEIEMLKKLNETIISQKDQVIKEKEMEISNIKNEKDDLLITNAEMKKLLVEYEDQLFKKIISDIN